MEKKKNEDSYFIIYLLCQEAGGRHIKFTSYINEY